MIKYLLKFVNQEAHAKTLLAGQLFMRPAGYYHALEQGQGDLREAAISHNVCIYKHAMVPIYCMYAISDTDINTNRILISQKCIHDFKCENGYIVIIEFSEFENKLRTLNSNGYEVDAGLVKYRILSLSDTQELLIDNTVKNLFVKHPAFSYQKEFRVIVAKQLYKPGDPPVDNITYRFSCALSPSKAQVIPISCLEQTDDYYVIQLEKLKCGE